MLEGYIEYILPAAALLVFLFPKKAVPYYSMLLIMATAARAAVGVANILYSTGIPYAQTFTPLSSVFAIPIVLVSIAVSIYSLGYLKEYLKVKSRMETAFHCLNMILLVYSMLGILSAENRMEFLFLWELMSLSSFVLVLWTGDGNRKNLHAALGYLIFMHAGFFLLLFGFCILPADQGLMGYGAMPLPIWLVFFIGFGIKAGIFPLHGWLPVTHPAAPSHVSALMSASMLNMGVYGIFRATIGTADVFSAGIILLAVGTVTALYGAYRSATEYNLKTLFAYSSMDNMGIILLGIGIGAIGKATGSTVLAFCGYCGALIHMLCHSSFKSLLFMSAGSVQQASGTLNLDSLGGLLKKMPRTGFFFLVAVLSAMAIPPLSGFAGEFVLLGGIFTSFAESHDIFISLIGLVVLAMVGGMTIVAMVKAFSRSMLSTPRTVLRREPKDAGFGMSVGMTISLLFVFGGIYLFTRIILDRSSVICGVMDSDTVGVLYRSMSYITAFGIILLAAVAILYLLRNLCASSVKYEKTWSCGAGNIPPVTQYGASSFSAEMSSEVTLESLADGGNDGSLYSRPKSRNRNGSEKISRILTRILAGAMHGTTNRLAHVQTGKVHHYIFYALLFIVLVVLLSLFGL